MGQSYYDRYGDFKKNGKMRFIPFIKLTKKQSDLKIIWKKTKRLDIISNEKYGSPFYGWLILMANPQFGSLEFDIPENAVLTIPFPLMDSLQDYQNKTNMYFNQNGNE